MATFLRRMARAALLDANLYEEVEADRSATGQAMLVVILASVASGIGYGTSAMGEEQLILPAYILLPLAVLASLVGWFVWALLTFWFGAKLFPEEETRSDLGELLRTIGFSSSPGLFRVFGVLAPMRPLILLAANLWMLIAMVIAVRQALDYRSTWRAIGICAWGWVVQFALLLPFWLLPTLAGRS